MTQPPPLPRPADAVIGAGFPKTGNTLIGQGIISAGKRLDPDSQGIFGFGQLEARNLAPLPNALLSAASPTAYVKTHAFKPFDRFPHEDWINPVKVIRITRNPLDTLLSYINYTRTILSKRQADALPPHLFRFYSRDLGFDLKNSVSSLNLPEMTLENLRDAGRLETALRSFSEKGLVIQPVHAWAGSWSHNFLSWGKAEVPLHSIKYEDTVSDKPGEIRRLAGFLEADEGVLRQGFEDQQRHMEEVCEEKVGDGFADRIFFNKAGSNYFVDYFDRASIRKFIEKHWPILAACGYLEWCEWAFHPA